MYNECSRGLDFYEGLKAGAMKKMRADLCRREGAVRAVFMKVEGAVQPGSAQLPQTTRTIKGVTQGIQRVGVPQVS